MTHPLPDRLSPDRRGWIAPVWTLWLFLLGAGTAAVGGLVRLAGTYERYLATRPLPPGWTSYQPPWADPAYRIGLAMLIAGGTIMLGTLLLRLTVLRRDSASQATPR
jgi:hypothetical protein